MYKILYTKKASLDIKKVKSSKYDKEVLNIINLIKNNPFEEIPPYKSLTGDFQGYYSRSINLQHRFIYQVFEKEKAIKIISLW